MSTFDIHRTSTHEVHFREYNYFSITLKKIKIKVSAFLIWCEQVYFFLYIKQEGVHIYIPNHIYIYSWKQTRVSPIWFSNQTTLLKMLS